MCGRFGHVDKFCRDNPKGQNYRGVPGAEVVVEARTRGGANAVSWREGENNESEQVSVQSRYSLYEVWLKRTFTCSALERGQYCR